MKLFFTVNELYESDFIKRYFHEISYLEKKEVVSEAFNRIKNKLSAMDLNAKTQAIKIEINEKMNLYFFDFKLKDQLNLSMSDFEHPLTLLISVDTKLQINSKINMKNEYHIYEPKIYQFPITIKNEEEYENRVKLILINLDKNILSEYLDFDIFMNNNEYASLTNFSEDHRVIYFRSYEHSYINEFLKNLETMPIQKIKRREYIKYKVVDLIYRLLEYNKRMKEEIIKKINLTSADFERIRKAKEILVYDIENPPKIVDLAKKVGLNETKLKMGFKQIYGSPIYTYLSNFRMEKAKYMLRNNNFSITEVSLTVGYSSMSKFSNAFRKRFGVNPSFFKSYAKNTY